MAKRQKLDYDGDELAHNLKQSTGQGVDALFSPLPPTPSTPPQEQPRQAEQDENVPTRTHARIHARRQASNHTSLEQEFKERILTKKHLASFTFRFQPEELEILDAVIEQIKRDSIRKVSKNDVIRLALNWLLKDYQENKKNSMLARVLASL